MNTNGFLPVTKEELNRPADFVLVTGDAYVDHPSFGIAIIGRLLESLGYSVGIIAQPMYNKPDAFTVFGKPRLAFLVTSGNIDSMVCNYTAAKKPRKKDVYSNMGTPGLRPDRALTVYCNKIREVYKDAFIIIGGLEASLRRLSHYDYWSDSVRRSVLLDSSADLLVYGMGESQITRAAEMLSEGSRTLTGIRGTVHKTKDISGLEDAVMLPDYEETAQNKEAYAQSFKLQYYNTEPLNAKTLVERCKTWYVVQNPPAFPLKTDRLDHVYSLKYMRAAHPSYTDVPALSEVKFSLLSHRGCFGGCNFCSLAFHQGRRIHARSQKSIIAEAVKLTKDPDFKGYIHDVGGPTANFRNPSCHKQLTDGTCKNRQCLFPKPCKNLEVSHKEYLSLLRKLRELPGVKKVFIRSGVRFDYLCLDKDNSFFNDLCRFHISGQLKVAPEHVSSDVLRLMGKPSIEVYNDFARRFKAVNESFGMKQFLVPYLISSHPGSDLSSAVELAEYLRDNRLSPEQVQDFYPTPGTLSTCMYHTGINPLTGEKVIVPKSAREKAMQRALIQYRLPQNYRLVKEALTEAGRTDLIGTGKKCLIGFTVKRSVKPMPRRKPPGSVTH